MKKMIIKVIKSKRKKKSGLGYVYLRLCQLCFSRSLHRLTLILSTWLNVYNDIGMEYVFMNANVCIEYSWYVRNQILSTRVCSEYLWPTCKGIRKRKMPWFQTKKCLLILIDVSLCWVWLLIVYRVYMSYIYMSCCVGV